MYIDYVETASKEIFSYLQYVDSS